MKWLAAALFAAGAASQLAAQPPAPRSAPPPSTLVVVVPTLDVRSPGEGELALQVTIASGWHVNSHKPSEDYLIATEAILDPAAGVRFAEAKYPDGKTMKFSFSESPLSVYDGTFSIAVPVTWEKAKPAPALSGSVDYQAGAVVSRTLVKKETGTVTAFAFDAGEGLSEHTTPFDALVVLIDGEAELSIAGQSHRVTTGQLLRLPAGRPHAVRAVTRFKMLLIMIRS